MSSKRELLPAAPVSYDLNDDERLKDLTMPQNRPDTVEVPTFVSSMVDPVQQDAANWKDMSPALIPTIGYTPPRVSPCANTHHVSGGKPANCTNDGKLSCGKCHLVKVGDSSFCFRYRLDLPQILQPPLHINSRPAVTSSYIDQ